jgi:peptidoglycan/LPS O-acetylase OafA/YrhL
VSAIAAHLFLLQDLFLSTAAKINYVFWSISVEWRIYFLFPVLIIMYRKIGAIRTTLSVLLLSFIILIILSFTDLNMKDYGINPQYLGLFSLGMLSSYVSFSKEPGAFFLRSRLGWQTFTAILLISVPLIFIGNLMKQYEIIADKFAIRDVIFGLFLYIFLSWLAVGKLPGIKRILSWQPLVFTGTFAYSVYLIHAPFLQVFCQYIIKPLNLPLLPSILFLLIIGTLAIVGISYLFFLAAEQPFMKKKRIKQAVNFEPVSPELVHLKSS